MTPIKAALQQSATTPESALRRLAILSIICSFELYVSARAGQRMSLYIKSARTRFTLDERTSSKVGAAVLRHSLLFFFVFGLLKFTAEEAAAIGPLMRSSPVLFWVEPLLGGRVASALIGVIEVALAALRLVSSRLRAYRGAGERRPKSVR